MKVVSGIRPSGHIHIGNYLGAISQWKKLSGVFFIADLHGLHTVEEIDSTVAALGRCGVDSVLQSDFGAAHLRLYTQLQHYATIGQLSRMTQYKDKAEKETETAALLTYPVLMAADIFHNGGTHVPVGNDQVQHIELARDLWDKLPNPAFPKPQAMVSEYPRIMSLKDGTRKMSKSDPDDDSRINLSDDADAIRRKIMDKAKTAMNLDDDTPEVTNLKTIYRAFGGEQKHTRWKDFKIELVDLIVAILQPSRKSDPA